MKFKLVENGKVIPFPQQPTQEPEGEETYDVNPWDQSTDPEPEDFGPEVTKRMRFTLVPRDEN